MSRRGAEFQHRTSVFEGAYRAWSHLGGLDPVDLETKSASELDPTNYSGDDLLILGKYDGTGRDYPYEPLPRSGLAHPFVKAILSPWLGPDVDEDGVKLGLETLRTWWQHRRKGQNASAVKALSSDKMRAAVDEYTRHFFQIAHCLIVSDKEQPPKGLQMRWRESGRGNVLLNIPGSGDACPNWNSLKQLSNDEMSSDPFVLKGKCVPGKLNLPEIVKGVNHKALQMAHRGIGGITKEDGKPGLESTSIPSKPLYGDPTTFPLVYCAGNDRQIAVKVNGITCAHCIKIVETVLKGCSGQKSPIDGLLDAAADQDLNGVIIKIDKSINAKRIAYEAARNLSLVGYKAESIEIQVVDEPPPDGKNVSMDKIMKVIKAFEHFGQRSTNFFDWKSPCACPDGGVYRSNCRRHTQMHSSMFDSFIFRKQQVIEHMSGHFDNDLEQNNAQNDVRDELNLDAIPVYALEDEEPIIVEQPMNLQTLQLLEPEPLPINLYPNETFGMGPTFNMNSQSYMQSQQFNQQLLSRGLSLGPSQQPVNTFFNPNASAPLQNVRGHSNFLATQQTSALATEYGLRNGFGGWDNIVPMLEPTSADVDNAELFDWNQ